VYIVEFRGFSGAGRGAVACTGDGIALGAGYQFKTFLAMKFTTQML